MREGKEKKEQGARKHHDLQLWLFPDPGPQPRCHSITESRKESKPGGDETREAEKASKQSTGQKAGKGDGEGERGGAYLVVRERLRREELLAEPRGC